MSLNYYQIKKNVRRARKLVISSTSAAGSGHPGGSFSMAEIVGVLLFGHMRYNPKDPLWPDRDRLVLSKGHAAPGLFANLAVAGYFDESEVLTLRELGSRLQGHPDLKCPGVEFCGGSLGIGLSFSIGVALASRLDGRDGHIFTLIGDGESDEGQVWEAAMTASKYNVDNLTAILDRNFIQQDSYTERIMPLDERLAEGDELSVMWKDASRWQTGNKWRAFGWNVIEIDGHRIEQIDDAVRRARSAKGLPTIIIARTIKGKGVEHMEDNPQWHGKAPAPDVVPIINQEIDSQTMISPSIIAGDMSDLPGEIRRCVDGRADYIHLDVMDGRFVPTTTFDYDVISKLRPLTTIPFDAHLMIDEPEQQVPQYVQAGCDIITVHAEVCDGASFGRIREYLEKNRVGTGLAINPETEIPQWAYRYLDTLDQLIVMSVVPGRSGQKFIESTHQKMSKVMQTLDEHHFEGYVEIDGGVNLQNVAQCFDDGARAFVGGGAIIGQQDVRGTIRDFRQQIMYARRRSLLKKAHQLGGAELVKRWMGLHTGQKDQLEEIARQEELL